MATRWWLLITQIAIVLQSAAATGASSLAAQDVPSTLCGRVVVVSCEGPASAVRLVIAGPGNSLWRVIIAPEQRPLFGSRIEDRYEHRLVCIATVPAATSTKDRIFVRDPSEVVVQGVAQAPTASADDVYRTCDPDVQLPTPVRKVSAQYTVEGMRAKLAGTILLHGVVDRQGAVRDVRVVNSLEPSMDVAARQAFMQWQFLPATRKGEPVAMAVSVEMMFTLR